MFLTFASSRDSYRKPKRAKVQRACNFCRQHRVRCDGVAPCSRCVTNDTECVFSPPRSTSRDKLKSRHDPSREASCMQASPTLPVIPEHRDAQHDLLRRILDFCEEVPLLAFDEDVPTNPYPAPAVPHYSVDITTLTAHIMVVEKALGAPNQDEDAFSLEIRAENFAAEMQKVHNWRDTFLKPLLRRPLFVDEGIHEQSLSSNNSDDLLLELAYYSEMISLHRRFITFPRGTFSNHPRSIPSDTHAVSAIRYAKASIELIHQHKSLQDRKEFSHWLWDAFLTLVAFCLAYPLCDYSQPARKHMQMVLWIFFSADGDDVAAVKAVGAIRSLWGKVDVLVHAREKTPRIQEANVQAVLGEEKSVRGVAAMDKIWDASVYDTLTIDPLLWSVG